MVDLIKQKTTAIVFHRATNYTFICLILACVFAYMYFANMTVHTLTVLEKNKYEMQSLNIKVSEMEAKRMVIDNSVGAVMAKHLGFVEAGNPTFIINKVKKATLSLKMD